LFAGTILAAQLAALSTQPIYLLGVMPTLLVATILAIAYDKRFALGAGCIHAVFVTLAANVGMGLLLVLVAGVLVTAMLLDEVRTRRKLVEVGFAAGLAMAVAAIATGFAQLDNWVNVLTNGLYALIGGVAVGVAVLGMLPFIEKAFRISTGMTLLELADVNHPLLRRLQSEAPGSYNHSMQVAVLAEEAARAIGANALLCRVAGYYHDVGKIHKSDYFIENQSGGHNRHLNLSPSVSLLIIIGHVKDGVELAREYNLPREVTPFIQEHHGTTLVEFFYRTAKDQQAAVPETERSGDVPESQYRYPGPKPRSKETAIMMLADTVESATRAMKEHNPSRIEARVHDLALKRLHDGQFDDCDLTLRELDLVKQSLVKSLLHIYHGRIEYPSDREAREAAEADLAMAAG
jgi:putative nucleotidyltransferase with HDIG domain